MMFILFFISLLLNTNAYASQLRSELSPEPIDAIYKMAYLTPVKKQTYLTPEQRAEKERKEVEAVRGVLLGAIYHNNIAEFEEVFNKNAIHTIDDQDLLTLAISKNRINFVEFLIRQNFNVNNGALEAVMENVVYQVTWLEMLVSAGADPNKNRVFNFYTDPNTGAYATVMKSPNYHKRVIHGGLYKAVEYLADNAQELDWLRAAIAAGKKEYKKRQEYYPEYVASIKNEITSNLGHINDLATICIEYLFAHQQVVPGMTLSDYIRPAREENRETDEKTTQIILTTEK